MMHNAPLQARCSKQIAVFVKFCIVASMTQQQKVISHHCLTDDIDNDASMTHHQLRMNQLSIVITKH